MSDGFLNFKHRLTGIVSRLPENYGELFPDTLEVVDEEEICNTCGLDPVEVVDVEENIIETPARNAKRGNNNSEEAN